MKNRLASIKNVIDSSRTLRRLIPLIGAAALAWPAAYALKFADFSDVEAFLYDYRLSQGLAPRADSRILQIVIDEKTAVELGAFSPLPLNYHSKLLKIAIDADPAAIGITLNSQHIRQVDPELFENEGLNESLQNSLELSRLKNIPIVAASEFDELGEVPPIGTFQALPFGVGIIHRDGSIFARDFVTRRAFTSVFGRASFHSKLATQIKSLKNPKASIITGTPSQVQEDGADANFFLFSLHRGKNAWIRPSHTPYPKVSFVDVLQHPNPRSLLTGRILLIGVEEPQQPSENAVLPQAGKTAPVTKLSVHAQILDSLLNNDFVIQVRPEIQHLVTFLTFFTVAFISLTLSPGNAAFLTLLISLSSFFVGYTVFQIPFPFGRPWFNLVPTTFGSLGIYLLTLPFRLGGEIRLRWKLEGEQQVRIQVEELKDHFLQLVTHDLKTPVARIQGLADMILRKNIDPVQAEMIRAISISAEELNIFITQILELNRIESKEVRIHYMSRDINQLIESSVERVKTLAHSKGLQILLDLEPMFPIDIDQILVQKVINNLVDNALKYAPAGSQIWIRSSDDGDHTRISVEDNGDGISLEDQKHLFTKFYRAKSKENITIKGTGLGLYLSKYFIEMHRGSLSLTSEPGMGCRFTIVLPNNQMKKPERNSLNAQSFSRG